MTHGSIAQISSEDIQKIIEEVRVKYAPDKRTAIFNISHKLEDKSHNSIWRNQFACSRE